MNSTSQDFIIHPDTSLVHVELQVRDLANMVAFYGGLLGFQVLENNGTLARLSPTGQAPALLTLLQSAEIQPQGDHFVGLYHNAFRFPGRRSLATTLLRLVAARWPLQGASDHSVSEAIYLADPEGNGIELYRDRPRQDWPRLQDSIQMGNGPLDLHKLLEEADQIAAEAGVIDPGTDLGHIHLQVSETAKAQVFYRDQLGFELMMAMPTALFLAAGGYHHHLGANTWQSLGATRRQANTLGLASFAVLVPDEAGWLAAFQRVAAHAVGIAEREGRLGAVLEDQDGIKVEFLSKDSAEVRQALDAAMPATVH